MNHSSFNLSGLNTVQQTAVKHLSSPLLVLAGAGSGKTRVITHKIAWLIEKMGYAPSSIAAVTFTNKAAREMQQRVGQLLRGKTAGLQVSTFHTFGLQLLRQEVKALGYKPNLTIMDTQDCVTVLKELLAHGDKVDAQTISDLQSLISQWKGELVSAEKAAMIAQDTKARYAALVYRDYVQQLRAYNAVDFDDLILLPVQLFQQHPEVLQRWQQKIRYLLVDEYQDTNYCQYELIKLLTGKIGQFTVVGDDDQSIYAWRGARPDNLKQLAKDYPQLQVVKLEQNYRSSQTILKAANHVIANNPHLFNKQLWSEKGHGEQIRVLVTKDEDHEAERVVHQLIQHQFKQRTQYEDYAILYRSNHQAKAFEKVLQLHRIPYFISGGTSFFARAEVKDVLAYLRVMVNPDDDAAFLRIVNVPRREIGATTLQKLGQYAQQRRVSLFKACFEVGLTSQLNERALGALQKFTFWLKKLATRAAADNPMLLAKEVVETVAYAAWMRSQTDAKTAEKRMENVNYLLNWLDEVHKRDGKTLEELVAHVTLVDNLERQGKDEQKLGVALMTLHAAKGLEFPFVFMVGMEEELLPHQNSLQEEGLQEERRLAYVGITRAQQGLTFSLTQRRQRNRETVTPKPSRFLAEIPKNLLEWEGQGVPVSEEKRMETGKTNIAMLKNILKR